MRRTRVIAIFFDGCRREKREERQDSCTGGNIASSAAYGDVAVLKEQDSETFVSL
jgi:hypothetical protein